MKRTVVAAAALVCATAFATASETVKRHGRDGMHEKMMQTMDASGEKFSAERANKRFAVLDADGDGVVTEAEFSAAAIARSAALFSRMDRNSDGQIGRDDATRVNKAHAKREKDGRRHHHFKRQHGGESNAGDSRQSLPE